jgi:hypothetical protein
MLSMLRHPVALLPIVMSGAAVTIVLVHLALAGTAPQRDEGTEAHLWQLLMAGQIPIVAFFGLTRLARNRESALRVLGLQAVAALAALAPVYLLRW